MKRKLIAGVCAFVTACSAAAATPDMTNHAALTASAVKLGDIDGNDTLNAADVKALANFLLTRSKQASGADLNSDGIVNAADLTLLKRNILQTPHLVWSDEFDGDSVDLTKWLYEPYEKLGGNGSAKRVMLEVNKLPIRVDAFERKP